MTLTMPQYIYLAAVGCYLLFFGLFLRLFVWKRYAETHFWHRRPALSVAALQERARAAGHGLPRFSIVVPARNEADVIERTVEHLSSLEYPADRYEIVVVTDEKEALHAERRRQMAVSAAADGLRQGDLAAIRPESEAGGLILAMLGALALEGFDEVQRRLGRTDGVNQLKQVPEVLLRPIIWEAADRLLSKNGRKVAPHLLRLLRVRLPRAGEDELQASYAALLSLAIPTAVAFCWLRGGDGRALGHRLATLAAQAHHSLTREIIISMCDALAVDLTARLEAAGAGSDLEERLAAIFREIYPTTQDIMDRKVQELAPRTDRPALRHVIVPRDFDGELGGQQLGVEVPSTKGRALNWALSYIDGRSAWCGFYDAESRPHLHVLLYLAYRDLESKTGGRAAPRLYQGPVFQVRNWYEMSPFCKVASLYQTVAHDWALPVVFRRLPFVSGTNLFVESSLLREIGGYDSASLTEDLELGTRAYLKTGAWPEYLPYPSSEQTPPTFSGFFRQRLRWATGHLQVVDKVRRSHQYDEAKKRKLVRALWLKGQGEWIFYQTATLVPPAMLLLWVFGWVDPYILGPGWHFALDMMSTVYIGFTIYTFFRYLEHLDQNLRPRRWLGQLGALAQLLVLPLAAFLFPVPYSSAMVLGALGRGPSAWVKTPRTRE